MSVSIHVGALATAIEEDLDPEMTDRLRGQFDRINEVLRRNGLPPHREPEDTTTAGNASLGFNNITNDAFENLRGVYAYCVADRSLRWKALGVVLTEAELMATAVPHVVRAAQGAFRESVVTQIRSPRHHLLYHSPWEGFFVPVDFPEVLEDDELDGGSLGSSVRLLAELVQIAAPLGITLEGSVLGEEEARRLGDAGTSDSGGGLCEIAAERVPLHTWLTLYQAATHSIRYAAAIALQ
jgi:hypothetical protein